MCPSSTSSSDLRSGVDQETLVLVPEDLPRGSPRRALALAVTAAFLAVLGGTGLVDTLWPAPRPQLIGLEKQADDAQRAKARLRDGSLAALIEKDLVLDSRVRSLVLPGTSLALFALLGEGGEKLIVGDDRWVFLRSRDGPTDVDAPAWTGLAAAKIAAARRRLLENGVRLLVAPVPRKSVACADRLPPGLDTHPEIEPLFQQALAQRGVPAVDLVEAFRDLPSEQLFHKYGTHWTDRAQELAAEAIAAALGRRLAPADRATRLVVLPDSPQDADLLEYVGLDHDRARRHAAGERCDALSVLEPSGTPLEVAVPPAPGDIGLAGTSFTARRALPALLQHATGARVVNGAAPGAEPFDSLRDLLFAGPPASLPPDVVLEVPLHIIFRPGAFPSASEIFTRLPPAGTLTVLPGSTLAVPPAFSSGAAEVGPEWTQLLRLPSGRVAHTGDGAASLRLRGRTPDGVQLQLRSGGTAPIYEWRPEQTELVLPLLAAGPTAEMASVLVRARGPGAASLELSDAEVVVTGRNPETLDLDAGSLRTSDGRWGVALVPRRPVALPDLATLWIDAPSALAPGGTLEVALIADDGQALRMELPGVAADGVLLASLSALRGRALREVRVSAAGAPPGDAALPARVLLPEAPGP